MSPIIALSLCLAVACGAIGLEWSQFSGVAFSIAAVASTVFFAAVDAWEGQADGAEE